MISALTNLAGLVTSLGNISYADSLYLKSIRIANPNADPTDGYASLYHNYGVFLHDLGKHEESIGYFEASLRIDENLYQSIYNIAEYECRKGGPKNLQNAQLLYDKAINIIKKVKANDHLSLKLARQTSVVPYLSERLETILHDRSVYVKNIIDLIYLMIKSNYAKEDLIPKPMNFIGCASLGYYLIYHGYEDLYVRQLMGMLYFVAANSLLKYQSPFLQNLREPVFEVPASNYPVHFKDNTESYIYLHGYTNSMKECIKVAFLSTFWYRHSVGILLKGVIKNLDRSIYCVTLILIDQINKQDHITADLFDSLSNRENNDQIVMLNGSLKTMREKISSLKLDVLVIGEIGMDQNTYFLSFYRLARRSIVFWGHATTSGLTGINENRIDSVFTNITDLKENDEWIGPDYFLSSTLFEKNGPDLAQLEYSERLILMDSMTTYFEKPSPPMSSEELGLKRNIERSADDFHLPDKRDFLVYLDPTLEAKLPTAFVLYGVPQTLYKVRADFDDMLNDILGTSPDFFLVLPKGTDNDMYIYLKERLTNKLGALAERVIFVRSLSEREFLTLIGVIDIVLDPFPVGGGRSSFEIFSVGTPIICLISETSILQLTAAMYATMKQNSMSSVNLDECCISHTKSSYVQKAIELGSNVVLRDAVRQFLLTHNDKLYNNNEVIEEWNKLLTCILMLPRPKPKYLKYDEVQSFRHANMDNKNKDSLFGETNWLLKEVQHARFTYNEPAIILREILIDKITDTDTYMRTPAAYYNKYAYKGDKLYSNSFIFEDYNQNENRVNLEISDDVDWKSQCYMQLRDVAMSLSPIMMLRMCAIAGVAVSRNFQYDYDIVPIQYSNKLELNLLIKEGDDLGLILRTLYTDLVDLNAKHGDLFDELQVNEIVEATGVYLTATTNKLSTDIMGSGKWVNYRSNIGRSFMRWAQSSLHLNSNSSGIHGLDSLSISCGNNDFKDQLMQKNTITLAISTSRRLHHFLQTMAALEQSLGKLPNSIISRVILVDDGSSEEDRNVMKSKYPSFEFYFKSPKDKGHANTMNKIFSLVNEQYLLYLEDDWKLLDQPVLLDSLASAVLRIQKQDSRMDHLFEAILLACIKILEEGSIQQILFNSQSTRACAVGMNCDYETIKYGGWERFAFYNNSISIPYGLHEFGIASHLPGLDKILSYGQRTHDFAMWPGLTLNPGLWNINAIKTMMNLCLNSKDKNFFNENEKLFEHRFSALGYAAGVSIGFLPSVLFEHIGDVSAYKLSHFKRPWDKDTDIEL